jgi:hypothetical protein
MIQNKNNVRYEHNNCFKIKIITNYNFSAIIIIIISTPLARVKGDELKFLVFYSSEFDRGR